MDLARLRLVCFFFSKTGRAGGLRSGAVCSSYSEYLFYCISIIMHLISHVSAENDGINQASSCYPALLLAAPLLDLARPGFR